VLQGGVSGQDRVVGLNNSGGHLGSWVDGEFQLGLLAIINRQPLHKKRSESRSSATSEAVEDEESLESSALVSQLPDAVKDQVDNLFADGVVASGIVVGSILLAGDQLLRVEQLTVGTSADLINYSGLQINKDSPGDMFASSSLSEESVETVVSSSNSLVTGHLTVRLDAMLKAKKFPAGIADLDSSLANVDRDTFTHVGRFVVIVDTNSGEEVWEGEEKVLTVTFR